MKLLAVLFALIFLLCGCEQEKSDFIPYGYCGELKSTQSIPVGFLEKPKTQIITSLHIFIVEGYVNGNINDSVFLWEYKWEKKLFNSDFILFKNTENYQFVNIGRRINYKLRWD